MLLSPAVVRPADTFDSTDQLAQKTVHITQPRQLDFLDHLFSAWPAPVHAAVCLRQHLVGTACARWYQNCVLTFQGAYHVCSIAPCTQPHVVAAAEQSKILQHRTNMNVSVVACSPVFGCLCSNMSPCSVAMHEPRQMCSTA